MLEGIYRSYCLAGRRCKPFAQDLLDMIEAECRFVTRLHALIADCSISHISIRLPP